jgi:hypothetical protein
MRSGEELDKPNDGSPSTNNAQAEITIDAGELGEERKGIATAEDFRKDWERRGRPQGIFGVVTNPLDPASLPIEEIERLGKIAKEASELWPHMKDLQAVAERFYSWSAVLDSTLKIMREHAELVTGLLPTPETAMRMAELTKVVTGLLRAPFALERMYAFPLQQFVTGTLAEGAVRYIRQTTPGLAKRQTFPAPSEVRDNGRKKEEAKAEEKPISPRMGKMLVDTTVRSLALLYAELREQPAIVRTPAEWEMLRGMKAEGKGKEIARWLNKRAQEAIRACKRLLEMRPGRKRKLESEKEGYKLALKVEAVRPQFEKGMRDKKELNRKRVRRLEQRLSALRYPPDIVECLMRYSRPVSAACAWVGEHSSPARDIQTVQNYYSKFRRLIAESKPNPPEKKS